MANEKNVEFVDARTPVKYCKDCGRPLPIDYSDYICPGCKENNLFREVRDYIRANDVNEYQVAETFNIPVEQVKLWIRNGRIEYKNEGEKSFSSNSYCARCGAVVTFGTLCSKCLRLMNNQKKKTGFGAPTPTDSKMHYLDK